MKHDYSKCFIQVSTELHLKRVCLKSVKKKMYTRWNLNIIFHLIAIRQGNRTVAVHKLTQDYVT